MIARTESVLWTVAVLLGAMSVVAWRVARPEVLPVRAPASQVTTAPAVPAESLGTRVLRVVATNPFRLERTPSRVPYGASASGQAVAVPMARIPDLQLRGLVGPPWRAVMEGATGTEGGVLVMAGDTLAGVRVLAVRESAVILRNPDTTWTLTMRRP